MIMLVRVFFLLATYAILALASLNLIKTGDDCLYIDAIFPSNTSIIYTGICEDGRWLRWVRGNSLDHSTLLMTAILGGQKPKYSAFRDQHLSERIQR